MCESEASRDQDRTNCGLRNWDGAWSSPSPNARNSAAAIWHFWPWEKVGAGLMRRWVLAVRWVGWESGPASLMGLGMHSDLGGTLRAGREPWAWKAALPSHLLSPPLPTVAALHSVHQLVPLHALGPIYRPWFSVLSSSKRTGTMSLFLSAVSSLLCRVLGPEKIPVAICWWLQD